MAYVSLGSRKRSLGGASALGGSGGGAGGGSGTAFSSAGLGTSMMGMARSTSTALSDSMKPPPGERPSILQASSCPHMHAEACFQLDYAGVLSALSLQGTRLPPL